MITDDHTSRRTPHHKRHRSCGMHGRPVAPQHSTTWRYMQLAAGPLRRRRGETDRSPAMVIIHVCRCVLAVV